MSSSRLDNSKIIGFRGGLVWIAFLLSSLGHANACWASEIWFAPTDHLPRHGVVYVSDFMDLFTKEAPWQRALGKISVWQLPPRFPLAASKDELTEALSFMNDHKLKLSVGMQMIAATDCGEGIEGMTKQGGPGAIARRIKKFGGDLRYVGMDEPWWFGHEDKRPKACHLSTDEVAHRVAESVREVRAVFPEVQIIDEEPISGIPGNDWLSQFAQWLDAYKAAVGEPLDAVHDDMQWHKPWQEKTVTVQEMLNKRGIKYGVMFTAGGAQESDAAWIEKAKQNITAYKQAVRRAPDHVYIASWNIHPSKVLPETEATTLTYLVNWYADHN